MKDWVKERLTERSTYIGIALMMTAAGVAVDAATVEVVVTGALAVAGMYEAGRSGD